MSLLVSDMRFLLDQNVVLGLAAVSLDRVDFIKIRAITRILMSRSGNALANVKRGCGEDDLAGKRCCHICTSDGLARGLCVLLRDMRPLSQPAAEGNVLARRLVERDQEIIRRDPRG